MHPAVCRVTLTESIRSIRIIERSIMFPLHQRHSGCTFIQTPIVSTMADLKKIFIFVFILTTTRIDAGRRKRYLIYPRPGSKVQFIVGTGVPIPLENHAITMGWVIKSMYLLPTNASQYTDSYVTFQKRSVERRASRYDFYRTFENAAESFGGGGKECMLRTICEASRIPLKASGLVGQILRIFLLPSSTDEVPLTRSDMDYHNAETLGREPGIDCRSVYPSCYYTLIDLLTVIL